MGLEKLNRPKRLLQPTSKARAASHMFKIEGSSEEVNGSYG
jgi:hypothetical protein